MSDVREALVALIRNALLSNAAHMRPVEFVVADAILAAGERVKPSEEDVARALATVGASYNDEIPADDEWEGWVKEARAVLALFPGRTETEVKAEALREAADEDCAPDCDERTSCDKTGLGHSMCGRCEHGEPRHHGEHFHCAIDAKKEKSDD